MDNNERNILSAIAREIMSSIDGKNFTTEQKKQYADEMSKIAGVFGLDEKTLKSLMNENEDLNIKDIFNKNGNLKMFDLNDLGELLNNMGREDKSPKETVNKDKSDSKTDVDKNEKPFLRREHGNNIDIEPISPIKKEAVNKTETSKTKEEPVEKNTNFLDQVIAKLAMGKLTISDLNKDTLEALVNDKRSTDSTINSVCKACNISRDVFKHLCFILNVEDNKPIISFPVDIKYISEEDDLSYFVHSFELLVSRDFSDKQLWVKLITNLISESTKQLELKGILEGTSATQVVIPFIKPTKSTGFEWMERDKYAFAIFNIPLNSLVENIDKVSIDYGDDGVPKLSIQK